MTQLFANNAYGSLGASLTIGSTSLTLGAGQGVRFPTPTGGDYFLLTLIGLDSNSNEAAWEIVKVTGRSTDMLTVTRAQESTAAAVWASGTRVEMRATAGSFAAKQDLIAYTPENLANKNVANGYAGLDSSGLVPSIILPSYVDDVLEYANLAALPSIGASGKIYVALDTNKTYRWSGSVYIEIIASPGSTDAVTEGSVNLYFTNARAQAALAGMYLPIGGGTLTGNLAISGTGRTISGDMSNTTASLRMAFQSSTTNGNTIVTAKPNGTGTAGYFIAHNAADADNSAYLYLGALATEAVLRSDKAGTGSYLNIGLWANAARQVQVVGVTNAVNYVTLAGGTTGANATIGVTGADSSVSMILQSKGAGSYVLQDNNGARAFMATPAASAVNYLQTVSAVTGAAPYLSAAGSDANISMVLAAKGTGNVLLQSNSANVLAAWNPTSAVNAVIINGNTTGNGPGIGATGSDTNIDLNLAGKGTGRVRIGGNEVATLASPTFTGLVTTAGQIKFPAIQNASADANTLDDYEEGTWTPIIVGVTNPTVVYTTQSGSYVKIGRKVFASFYIAISSFSGGSGRGGIGGLPFTASNIGSADDQSGSIQEHSSMLIYPSARTWVTLYVVNGTNFAPIAANGSNIGGAEMVIGTNIVSASGGYILGAVTYTSA